MPQMILRQPDGLYCVFSTVVDDFLVYDASPEELWEWHRERAEQEARRQFDAALERAAEEGTSSVQEPPQPEERDWRLLSQIRVRDIQHGGEDDPGLTPDDQQAEYMRWLAKWRNWTPGQPLPR